MSLSRRTILLCLVAIVPVLAGGAVGAFAGGLLPGSDLVTTAPTGTQVTPSQHPAIDTVAGVADVGLEESTPFSGVRRPAGGPLLAGPPQEKGDEIGPQLVAPDGTITAVWSTDSPRTLHAARLAPGATTWVPIATVANASIGPEGAVIAPDGSITAVTFSNTPSPATVVSRRLLPGSGIWDPPVTIETLAAGRSVSGDPQIVRSPTGVTMAGWSEDTANGERTGGALQATDGTWPAEARDLVGLAGVDFGLGGLAVPDSGRSGRLIMNEEDSSSTPEDQIAAEQITDTGPVPMNSVPPPSQGGGFFFALGAAFTTDDTLRIIGLREGGLSESDVPPTHNGQLPEAPYTVVDGELTGGIPALATLPDGEMLLAYGPEDTTAETETIQLLRRPVGAPWSAPEQLQAPIPSHGGGVEVGGIAVDAGGDAYITWSTLTPTKGALAGAIIDNSPPVIDGLSLHTAVAGTPVQLGVTDHDAWSSTTTHWDFGDGTSGDGNSPTHTYATPGERTVTVTVTDAAGNQASISGKLNVDEAPPANSPQPPPPPKDKTAPKVSITPPSCPKKLSAAACRERRATATAWRTVRGTATDAGGIASVTLQATSGSGKKCLVLKAKGQSKEAACAKAAKLKAKVKGSKWTVKTPGLAKGTWKLKVLATDKSGNVATAHLTLRLTS